VPPQWLGAVGSAHGRRLFIGIRPEDVRLASAGVARMRIDAVESMGNETILHGVVGPAVRLTARAGPRDLPDVGSEHGIELDPSRVHLFDGESEERLIESSG
jgi:multiple sugar transport system ATP-binding protein